MKTLSLKEIVKIAGGSRVVGVRCGVSYQAVQKWIANGLPRTEFSSETNYSALISELCSKQGRSISGAEILEISRALLLNKAA